MKKDLRKILLQKRDSIKPEDREAKEANIKRRLFALSAFRTAKCILFYASFRSEVGTIPSIQHALKLKRMVALPLVDPKKRGLRLYKINDISELKPGYMGISEPTVKKKRAIDLKDIDVAIIPGAGFDAMGNRLGYGYGYYDKLLSTVQGHFTKIALAFEEQIIPQIPNEIHDVRVDKIVTDKRVINCDG